ncbi:heterokaryon incompatibility protein-domain-containing protein [Hypoxylon sp. NC0597]|nr:heterokaryon incompatibility protein-domain-containing protein [Hypoxylon sp. NC0597]
MANRVIYFWKLITHSFSVPVRIFGFRLSAGFWIRWTKDAELLAFTRATSGIWQRAFRGVLREAALDSVSGQYEAISFVWGEPSSSCMMDLGEGCYLPLTRNLTEALYQLRHEGHQRILWVDALCVNQHDIDERAQQFILMFDIYRWCNSILVWLGMPTTHSALGMEILSYIINSSIQIDRDGAPWVPCGPSRSKAALQDILTRPYFHRL